MQNILCKYMCIYMYILYCFRSSKLSMHMMLFACLLSTISSVVCLVWSLYLVSKTNFKMVPCVILKPTVPHKLVFYSAIFYRLSSYGTMCHKPIFCVSQARGLAHQVSILSQPCPVRQCYISLCLVNYRCRTWIGHSYRK